MNPVSALRILSVALILSALVLPPATVGAQTTTDDDVVYEVLAEGANEPLQLDITPDGRIIWAERDGTISVLTPEGLRLVAGQLTPSGNLCETCGDGPVFADPGGRVEAVIADPAGAATSCTPQGAAVPPGCPAAPDRHAPTQLDEGGLHGLLLHRDFAQNDLIFLYYSVPGTRREVAPGLFWGEFHLATFRLDPDTNRLDPASEDVVLRVPAEWDNCCHYGGDLEYLPDGTLILTTGDDVPASSSGGYGARDARSPWLDAELTSANPADRRGKILRLREDGTVPDGSLPGERPNPFLGQEGYNPHIADDASNVYVNNEYVGNAVGTPGDGWLAFDPYVYSLGWKQPWRAAVLTNGDLYIGDVGPDAGFDDPERGPRGFDETNRVPFGGGTHHGWPRCIGPNWSYMDVDWVTLENDGPLDCSSSAPVARPLGGEGATVRGMEPALMYYANGRCDGSAEEIYPCDRWPIVGSGGKTSQPTVVYPSDVDGPLALPERYRDRLFVLEWSRNYLLTIPVDPATGDLDLRNESMDRVVPPLYTIAPKLTQPQTSVAVQQGTFMRPVDGVVGPDGAYYFLEYGLIYYAGENGRLSRIRGADAQLDAGANYGLPTAPADPATATAGSASPAPMLAGFAVTVLSVVITRRRRGAVV
jgi:glucose/arabinose dehydrogenase